MCGLYCPHAARHSHSSAEPYKGGPAGLPPFSQLLSKLQFCLLWKLPGGEGTGSAGQQWLNMSQMAKEGQWHLACSRHSVASCDHRPVLGTG